jgi:Putative transposase
VIEFSGVLPSPSWRFAQARAGAIRGRPRQAEGPRPRLVWIRLDLDADVLAMHPLVLRLAGRAFEGQVQHYLERSGPRWRRAPLQLAMLMDAHDAGQLKFFNTHAGLADNSAFKRFIGPLRHIKWVVYCKAPFAGPKQVLRYLCRYTHRVAISNRRLIAADDAGVAFRCKDYRADGPRRWKTMRLHPHEFIRRFLLHVLPKGFHRIRHYGLLASANRGECIATARARLGVASPAVDPEKQPDITPDTPRVLPCPCPRCGARMIVIEVFARGCETKLARGQSEYLNGRRIGLLRSNA